MHGRSCVALCAVCDIALRLKGHPAAQEKDHILLCNKPIKCTNPPHTSEAPRESTSTTKSSHINPNGYLKPWHSAPITPVLSLADGRRALFRHATPPRTHPFPSCRLRRQVASTRSRQNSAPSCAVPDTCRCLAQPSESASRLLP